MDNGGRGGDFSGCLSRLACFCCLARSGIWRHVHSSHCQYRSICQTSLCSLHTSWFSPIRARFSGCVRYAFQRNYHHSAYPRQRGWQSTVWRCVHRTCSAVQGGVGPRERCRMRLLLSWRKLGCEGERWKLRTFIARGSGHLEASYLMQTMMLCTMASLSLLFPSPGPCNCNCSIAPAFS